MDEIELKFSNSTPFCELSREFPDLTVFRWCSSVIDYVEMYGKKEDIQKAGSRLKEVTKAIDSNLLSSELVEKHSESAISCRCTTYNSTIRLAESMNLMWEAPAVYMGGEEILRLVSFSDQDANRFYLAAQKNGTVQVVKKKTLRPDSLREIYSISLSDILGKLSLIQLKYLRDAIVMGMFSSPRRAKIEDLARSHDISKSTMQEHVNKARNKLLQAMEPYITLFLHSRPEE